VPDEPQFRLVATAMLVYNAAQHQSPDSCLPALSLTPVP
jgi:hypothetical protein